MNSYWYLASAYSKHPDGLATAFRSAVHATGVLLRAGVPVFSPIVHSHPIANICEMDPLDLGMWLRADQPMIEAAHGCIVLNDGGYWEQSEGVAFEIECFRIANKPILFMDPGAVPAELVRQISRLKERAA